MTAYRITVIGAGVNLRGHVDSDRLVERLAVAIHDYGWTVVASPQPPDWDTNPNPPPLNVRDDLP